MPPTLASELLPLGHISQASSSSSACSNSSVDIDDDAQVPSAECDSASSDVSQYLKKGGKCEFLMFNPDSLKHIGKTVEERKQQRFTQIGEAHAMTFKMVRSDTRLIRTLLHSYGFTQCSSKNPSFNVIWTGANMQAYKMRSLQPWQRLNQFPRSTELTRKDKLYENIARSQSIHGESYDFIPEFYVTPRDTVRMRAALQHAAAENACVDHKLASNRYIVKPVSASQGRGIFFTDNADDVPSDTPLLVSRYIDDPLLVNGHKFDLRIYVAVTSFYPLVTYIYSEGLARFASGKYCNSSSGKNEFVHLTNYSINKNSKDFIRNESMDSEDLGHKWTLGALLRHLEKNGIDSRLVMLRIEDLIIKSLLSVQVAVAAQSKTNLNFIGTNFELFGFDVLIDENLKPWLLEVNLSPSLSCDAPLDSLVKPRLVSDLFNLACIPLINKKVMDTAVAITSAKQEEIADSSGSEKSPTKTFQKTRLAVKRKVNGMRVRRIGASTSVREGFGSVRGLSVEARLQIHIKKLLMEDDRKGEFIRVFPREHSFPLYSDVMEDAGYEKFDRRIYEHRFGVISDERLVEMSRICDEFHSVMMTTAKYPSMSSLSLELQAVIAPWHHAALAYTAKVTKEGVVYAAKLPVVRVASRLRTRSCAEYYDLKKAKILEARQAMAAAALTELDVQQQTGSTEKENAVPKEEPLDEKV